MRGVYFMFGLIFMLGCVPSRAQKPLQMATRVTVKPSQPFELPLKRPVQLLSKFGPRDGKPHTGLDLRNGKGAGEPVLASRVGRVMAVGWVRGYGRQAVIEHPDGYRTRYAHMSAVRVRLGQRVEQGANIGKVGSTGRSSAPHLHFEIITPDGKFIDPLHLLPRGQIQLK